MRDSKIIQYIKELSVNNVVNEIIFPAENPFFDKIFQIKPNKIFSPKFLIAFSGPNKADIMKLLDELVKINEQNNKNKPTPCILFVQSNMILEKRPESLTFSNGILYVHIAVFDQEKKQVFYEKHDYYFGVKHIKKAINLFESIL